MWLECVAGCWMNAGGVCESGVWRAHPVRGRSGPRGAALGN